MRVCACTCMCVHVCVLESRICLLLSLILPTVENKGSGYLYDLILRLYTDGKGTPIPTDYDDIVQNTTLNIPSWEQDEMFCLQYRVVALE